MSSLVQNSQEYLSRVNLKQKSLNKIQSTKLQQDKICFIPIQESRFRCTAILIQNLLKSVRNKISKKKLAQSLAQMNDFFEKIQRKQKISSSPSRIITSNQGVQSKEMMDLYFTYGISLLQMKKYHSALQILNQVATKQFIFKKNLGLCIAVCYQRLHQYQKSLEILQKTQTKSIDQFFLKAKILKILARTSESQIVLKHIIQIQPTHFQSILLLLQIYHKQKLYSKALSLIDLSILSICNQEQLQHFYSKKAQYQYLNTQYQRSFQSIQFLQRQYKIKQSKWNYLKGKICLKLRKLQDSVLYFNQALQVNSNVRFVSLALSELVIYFLKQRDFYQAEAYCKRNAYILKQCPQIISNLSFLAEGLILLMKRNFKQGLKAILNVKIEVYGSLKEQEDINFLRNLYFNALGFSHFSLGNHRQALNSYHLMRSDQKQQEYLPCLYNIMLCQGILSILQNIGEEKAIQYFQRAIDYLLRPQPYFYISVILTVKNLNYEASSQIFLKILSILESGINVSATSQMHFYRALVFTFLGMNAEAINDIDKAIQISEDNVVQHFYAKGLIYFLQQNYEQAISQFEVALSIDQKSEKVLLQKSKCQLIYGNIQQAYADLQSFRQVHQKGKRQNNKELWEVYFMLHQRRFEDILQYDLETDNIMKPQMIESIEEITNTCNFFLGKFQECGSSGKLVLALIYESYEDLLKLLNEALELRVKVGPLSQIDLKFIKAYVLFKTKSFDAAILVYEDIQNLLALNENQWILEEIQFKFLIVKINVIFILYAQRNLKICAQKLESLIQEINQGDILIELKQILEFIEKKDQQNGEVNGQKYAISLFNQKQMLSSFLSLTEIQGLSMKLLIPFPVLEVSQIRPNRENMLEQYEFNKIQNRPEAPWIKRGQFGVIFTNQIRQFSNLHLNTEQCQVSSRQKLIDDLKLGSEVLLKLQKFKGNN